MTCTHGDLFREIGALVVAAHDGQSFDLKQTAEELARCYVNLGVPAETIARALARSMAAVGVSMAILRPGERPIMTANANLPDAADPDSEDAADTTHAPVPDGAARSGSMLFPSGVRLAVLS
jgi:hypothetical protein